MKKRLQNKILKRAGMKLHNEFPLSAVENRVCKRVTESKVCSALCKFRNEEFEAGTIYSDGYMERLMRVFKKVISIESVTGVHKQ